MMKRTTEQFADYDCVKIENDALQLYVTRDVGPRIIGLRLSGGDNLLAVLPHRKSTTPSGKLYHFRGGHRLWYAPEEPEQTYLPDDSAVIITEIPNGIRTTQAVEAGTGIEKQMTITLINKSARVIITHSLTNRNAETAVELAPWAITQMKTGGFAILPQPTQDTGLLANRRLALWPYTHIQSHHLQLGDKFIFVRAAMQDEKFKVGWANPAGWLGYCVDNTLFIKQAPYHDGATYYDFGSSSECYCDDDFLELETLGPRTTLAPGASITHQEIWRVYPDVALAADETTVKERMSQLLP
ncbi:MAG: hypothetical protein WAM60_12605 [Candidatus Promineifilaceae bacterium]